LVSFDGVWILCSSWYDCWESGADIMDEEVSLRQQALVILFKQFGNRDDIYECADEWVSKQVTTSGLVNYYKAYYNK